MLDPSFLERIGAYVGDDGGYYRDRVRVVNYEYDESDPQARAKGLVVAYDEELVPHPVVLPLSTDPESIEEARQSAVRQRADFYHPQHGWLRWGTKREKDWPENMAGESSRLHKRRRVTVAPPRDDDRDAEPEPEPAARSHHAAAGAPPKAARSEVT